MLAKQSSNISIFLIFRCCAVIPSQLLPSGSRGQRVPAQGEAEAESQVPQEAAAAVAKNGLWGEIWGRDFR